MKKFLTLALVAGSLSGFAQQKMVADKIIGIVGDKIVLNSDIMNEINDAKRRGVDIPKGSECGMLQQALATKALVLQAEKDSLPLTDDDVEARLDLKIREFIRMYGSKDALEQVAQRTVYQIKEDFRLPIREGLLAEQMRDKLISGVKVTPAEVKEFFEKIPKDSLQFFESEYELGEIMVYPKASRDIELLAIEELNGFKKQVESGSRKFENLADLYSDDKGTQQQGGTLLLNRTEQIWDPTFKAAAFRLKEGQISPVIKSKFGFHIIQLISRSGDDALVRHILKIPQVTQTEIDEAIVKLDSVRAKLIAGTLEFGRAVSLYSDDEFGKFNTGGLRVVTIDQMDKDLVKRLSQLKIGEFSQPLPFKDEREKQGVRIVYIRSKTEPHRMNMKDDYNKVAEMAKKEKEFEVLEKWFNTRIPDFYIMIDESYSGCPELAPWIKEAVISKAN
ncbi:MAG: peptidylprolyl isomerase [Chitinophagaceae bacterium]